MTRPTARARSYWTMLAVFAAVVTSCTLSRATPDRAMTLRPGLPHPGEVLFLRAERQSQLAAIAPDLRRAWCPALPGRVEPLRPVGELRDLGDGPDPATEPFAWQVMVAAAAGFGAGDAQARHGLAALLRRWAGAHAMRVERRTDANSRYALDRTLLPTIVAFWLLQDDPVWPSIARDEVALWLDDLVRHDGREATPPREVSARNNHHYLRASVVMAWGALTGDAAAFARGPAAYRDALRDMRADGSLPLETRRGARALWYQRHAIASLVTIAELAAVQGQDLYGMELAGRSLHGAVRFLLDGIADPRRVWRYAAANDKPGPERDYRRQDLGFLVSRGHGRHYMAWTEIYAARFPERPETRRLLALVQPTRAGVRPMVDDYSGGNTTCFFARAGS